MGFQLYCYGSCGQYERNVTTAPLVPDSADRPLVPGYARTSKVERLLNLKQFQYMSNATLRFSSVERE